jgi:hypothetical protein
MKRVRMAAAVLIAASVGLVGGVAVERVQAAGGGLCGYRAGCGSRDGYNSCLNCCTANGCAGECGTFCALTFRPRNPLPATGV